MKSLLWKGIIAVAITLTINFGAAFAATSPGGGSVGPMDYQEECLNEGCSREEIHELCGSWDCQLFEEYREDTN